VNQQAFAGGALLMLSCAVLFFIFKAVGHP